MSLYEINPNFIAVHKAEYFSGSAKTLYNLVMELDELANDMYNKQEFDISESSAKDLIDRLEESKGTIDALKHLLSIKRRAY
jgi:hypothetical protein